MTTQTADMVITVLDTATIFEGAESVYRYDLPGSGIIEGWAVTEVLEQAKTLLPTWPEVEITIDADPEILDILTACLTEESVQSAAKPEAELESELPEIIDEAAPTVPLPRAGDNSFFPSGNLLLYVAMGAVILTICGVAWWAVENPKNLNPTPVATADVAPTGEHTTPELEIMSHGVIQLELPRGFQIQTDPVDATFATATGQDPELRILLAYDPLNDATKEAILAEVHETIQRDPALDPSDRLSSGKPDEIVYVEKPEDGSQVLWAVWVDTGHLISIGCHTKTGEANIPQRATCRQVAQTVSVRG